MERVILDTHPGLFVERAGDKPEGMDWDVEDVGGVVDRHIKELTVSQP